MRLVPKSKEGVAAWCHPDLAGRHSYIEALLRAVVARKGLRAESLNLRRLSLKSPLVITAALLCVGCATDSSDTVTRTRALAYAHAVNLRAGDVPGLKPFTTEVATKGSIFSAAIEGCSGFTGIGQLVGVSSPRFRAIGQRNAPLRSQVAYSAVYVAKSGAIASQDVRALNGQRFRRCLERYRAVEAAAHPKINGEQFKSQIRVSPLSPTLPGVRPFGLRESYTLSARFARSATRQPAYEDVLGFAVGPAIVVLKTESVPHPVAGPAERRLLTVLLDRARRTKLDA